MFNKLQKYSIRKLTIGAASVLIGVTFVGVNADIAQADTETTLDQNKTDENKKTIINTDETKEDGSSQQSSSSVSTQKDEQKTEQSNQQTNDANNKSVVDEKNVQGKQDKQEPKAASEQQEQESKQDITAKKTDVEKQNNPSDVDNLAKGDDASQDKTEEPKVAPSVTKATEEKSNTNTGAVSVKDQAANTTDLKTKDLKNDKSATDLAKLFGISLFSDVDDYNADDWNYTDNSDGSGITLTGYKGAATTDYYIPNAATFRDAGKINDNQGVSITYELMHNLYNGKDYNLADNPGIGYKLEATSIHVQRAAKKADMVKAVGGFVKNGLHNCWDWVFSPDLPESVDRNSEDTYKDGQNSNWALESVDLAGLDTSTVDRMAGMFAANASLETISGLDTWDTSKVATTGHMFAWDISLDKIQGLEN